MRKGYGPTGISYALSIEEFTSKARLGLVHTNGEPVFNILAGRQGLTYTEALYYTADCVCYRAGRETLVMRWEA